MLLLLSNDDGIDAPGLGALIEGLSGLGRVVVSAPAREQSARSHGFTMHRPLRFTAPAPDRWAVAGTPADSVYVGLSRLAPLVPELVVTGINRGANLGDDVHYSGTVAAAREAALEGVPALAVSLEITGGEPFHWETAVALTLRVIARLVESPLPAETFLSLNVPNVPLAQVRGIRPVALGRRRYVRRVDMREDPRGRAYCWLGGEHLGFDGGEGTDGVAFEQGWATLVPLQVDFTAYRALDHLRSMTW